MINIKKLAAFLKEFSGVPITTAISLLKKGKAHDGGGSLEAFQRGEFVITNEKEARAILTAASRFQFVNKFQRAFIQAVTKVIEAKVFPIDDLIKKVNAEPDQLKMHENYKKYLINLEEIASKGKHKRVAIY